MERSPISFKEIVMRGKPYTFVVSLYCTLMMWSAFLSMDRQAFAVAGVGGAVAQKFRAHLGNNLAVLADAPAGVLPVEAVVEPASESGAPFQAQADNSALTFKDVSEYVSKKGDTVKFPESFYKKFGVDNGGQPLPLQVKKDESKEKKFVAVGKIKENNQELDIAVVFRAKADLTDGAAFVTKPDGTWIRGYKNVNGVNTRVEEADVKDSFIAEKKFWVEWLPTTTVAANQAAGK